MALGSALRLVSRLEPTFNVGYHAEHHDFPNIPGEDQIQARKSAMHAVIQSVINIAN